MAADAKADAQAGAEAVARAVAEAVAREVAEAEFRQVKGRTDGAGKAVANYWQDCSRSTVTGL